MTHSCYDVTPYFPLPWRSNNYTVRDGQPVANGLDFDTGITTSNSGLNSPITDIANYLAFLAGDPSNPVYDIVPKARRSRSWSPGVADHVHGVAFAQPDTARILADLHIDLLDHVFTLFR
jgi:hypothetical protein